MSSIELLIPAASGGRLVMGNPMNGYTTDRQNRPYTDKHGQPVTKFSFNIAVPKTDSSVNDILQQLSAAGKTGFPNLFDQQGTCLHPQFAFKYVDGDSVALDMGGVRWCDKEGYPGNWVFKLTTQFAPKCYVKDASGKYTQIINPQQIKTGDYIRAQVVVSANGDTSKPGLYLNPTIVEFVGPGEAISSGPDANAVFGGTPAIMPVTTPGFAGPQPVQPVQPAYDFLKPPATAATPVLPPPPVEAKYNLPGQGVFTHSQLVTAGFTEQQISALQKA